MLNLPLGVLVTPRFRLQLRKGFRCSIGAAGPGTSLCPSETQIKLELFRGCVLVSIQVLSWVIGVSGLSLN